MVTSRAVTCTVPHFMLPWHGTNTRATATCAATATWVCPTLFIPFLCTTMVLRAQRIGESKTTPFYPKIYCCQTSVYFPPPATLNCWFLLLEIKRGLPSFTKQCWLFHVNSFLQMLTPFPFWYACRQLPATPSSAQHKCGCWATRQPPYSTDFGT